MAFLNVKVLNQTSLQSLKLTSEESVIMGHQGESHPFFFFHVFRWHQKDGETEWSVCYEATIKKNYKL